MSQWNFPSELNVVEDPEILAGYAADALYRHQPSALARPKTVAELQALVSYCYEYKIPLTSAGNQTSMTGASVSEGGLLLSMRDMPSDWHVYEDPHFPGRWLCDAGPALILSELQDSLVEKGYFYPPDPTSRREILLGSTVATNASGEDSYKYGSTRRWVRGLDLVKSTGEFIHLEREPKEQGDGRKNTSGYPIRDNPIDLVIGSEGTLGIITRLTLEVLPKVPHFFSILFFLPNETSALDEVLALHNNPAFELQCLEYMDKGAVAILNEKAEGLHVPNGVGAGLYVKQVFDGNEEEKMGLWLDHLEALYERLGHPELLDFVQIASDIPTQMRMRAWRHLIPATINERAATFRAAGGGKVGTDWYVPHAALHEMFRRVRLDQDEMPWVVFGHIGNGHPHFNFIARDAEEYARARGLLFRHCEMACEYGGGVSGEHGLGKLKTHLLALQYPPTEIEAMLQIKHKWDPKNILAPGNIFARDTK